MTPKFIYTHHKSTNSRCNAQHIHIQYTDPDKQQNDKLPIQSRPVLGISEINE